MDNLPNPAHPTWCRRGPECADGGGLHLSELRSAAPHGDEVIQISAGLWRMDVGSVSPSGVILEPSCGTYTEQWLIGLAQSQALLSLLDSLLRPNAPGLGRAA